jgi:hypothetical protein
MSNTNTPIDGSEGGYHDPFPQESIDDVNAGLAHVKEELAPFNGKAPPMNDPSGRTAAQFWNLKYLFAALSAIAAQEESESGSINEKPASGENWRVVFRGLQQLRNTRSGRGRS